MNVNGLEYMRRQENQQLPRQHYFVSGTHQMLLKLSHEIEVKRFTEITVHRSSVVTIRFTILFLRVSIRFGSLKCKQKLSVNC